MIIILIGILGLCAIVLSSPYDIPTYVPDALMLLCERSHDPDLIQVRIFRLRFFDCREFFVFSNQLKPVCQNFVVLIMILGMNIENNLLKINYVF
jgi:hypothetical protein